MCSTIHALALGAALTGCAVGAGEDAALEGGALKLPHALKRKDLPPAITAATLRAQQPWLDDAAFATKLAGMRASPLALLGGASATFHADLGGVPASRLPGDEVLCHGDPSENGANGKRTQNANGHIALGIL